MYSIVKCSNCGTVQYILKDQKTRTCPRCKRRLICKELKVFDTAQSVTEASQLVRIMKSPAEINQRLARLKSTHFSTKTDYYGLLGDLITELLAIFPKAMPKYLLIEKSSEFDIPLEFTNQILQKLHDEGLMLINKDGSNKNSQEILKFPSLPFKIGNIWIKKPIPSSKFRKKKWN